MYTIGIHVGHDATVALINSKSEIIAAIAEERLTRVKYITGFPYRALEEVLKIGKIKKEDVGIIALASECIFHPDHPDITDYFMTTDLEVKKKRDLFNDMNSGSAIVSIIHIVSKKLGVKSMPELKQQRQFSKEYSKQIIQNQLNNLGFGHAKLEVIEHHHTHAASAFYTCGFNDALVITIDGAGDGICATASISNKDKIKRVSSAPANCSPGRFYSEITRFAGFKRNRHEGKMTGLAAYGDPSKYYNELKQYLNFNPEKEEFEYKKITKNKIWRKIDTLIRIIKKENFANPYIDSFYAYLKEKYDPEKDMKDLAAAAQKISEEIAVEYVSHFLKRYPNKNLVLAGGLFANVRVNQEISKINGIENIFVHQNMGDGGCALGAALSTYHETYNNPYQGKGQPHVYFGNSYSNDKIENSLKSSRLSYQKLDNIELEIARLIHSGKVVGRFNGGMEYGPRALGNRSLLASPVDKTINDWLNKKLNRTEFMPFAPSVLEEEAKNIFENYDGSSGVKASYFMTITYDVKKEWKDRMQATTHIDGTARPQVVRESDNPSYYKIISEYFKLSGIPGIINTSFNMHEEPIVATPEDAIRSFQKGAMDYLAIGDFLCKLEE